MCVDARVDVLLRACGQLGVPFEGCRAMLGPISVVYIDHLLLEMGRIDIGVIVGSPVAYLISRVWRAGAGETGVDDVVAAVFRALGQCGGCEEGK